MEVVSLRPPVLPPRPFPAKSRHRKIGTDEHHKRRSFVRVFARKNDASNRNYDGRLVDENMIVLRMRIQEMKMAEENYEPPSGWMEWEKRYYANYNTDICEAVGFLQTQLTNMRPSLALGLVALVTLSVPISTAVAMSHLFEITKWILSGTHLV
ncbi:PREDICTED: uncharacterized protein LOC104596400 [Nelumbo nucifera]|uniref:Mediator of RNA polymerase II transcription subunit n=2 Tax=Nelumbo nucifera TaxID=4432 RepID=A0A822YSL4_NELNU|nr:PREDICTED: uncharacterized protein LOC104596400 [Nelumbo nucifera]DAD35517.1 TPA_asm: hypothetical protein HUJ06_006157 [Nelumbo nucifera]